MLRPNDETALPSEGEMNADTPEAPLKCSGPVEEDESE